MPPTQATDLLSLTPDELDLALKEHFEARGQPAYRSAQVRRWIYEGLAPSIEQMTDLPVGEREALHDRFAMVEAEAAQVALSEDGTVKHLWRLADGELIATEDFQAD